MHAGGRLSGIQKRKGLLAVQYPREAEAGSPVRLAVSIHAEDRDGKSARYGCLEGACGFRKFIGGLANGGGSEKGSRRSKK